MSLRYLEGLNNSKYIKYFQICPSLPTAAWSGLAFACDENGVAHQIHNLLTRTKSFTQLLQSAQFLHIQYKSDTNPIYTMNYNELYIDMNMNSLGNPVSFQMHIPNPVALRASSQFSTPKAFGFKACETGKDEDKHRDSKKKKKTKHKKDTTQSEMKSV